VAQAPLTLPPLTAEERAQALEKAGRARKARAQVKEDLKTSKTSLKKVIEDGQTDEFIGKLKVLSALEALPGVGKVKAKAIMDDVGIAETRRIRGLGPHQAAELIERFG